jgi:putative ABC transport system permease protein
LFYVTYLYRELTRRAARTLFTAFGMAVGIGLVVAITAVSAGLDRAQDRVLYPLGAVGTDLIVTRTIEGSQAQPQQGAGPGQGFPGGSQRGLTPEDQAALLAENQSVITDLSQLGKPGDRFVHDFFLPATQLTFPADQSAVIAGLPNVAQVASGLTLLAVHQEGTVPQIVAEIQTGGETFTIERTITPLTDAERAKVDSCLAELRKQGQGTGGGGGAGLQRCLPERFQRLRTTFTTPQRTITQALNPPQTDIKSDPYTIAGVDTARTDVGIITPAQIVEGRFFAAESEAKEAVLAQSYAERKSLAIGSELDLNGTKFTVIGLASPPLGGQAADVYLSLEDLQALAKRDGRVNVLLVRATDAASVSSLADAIEAAFPGAQVTSAKDLADRVSGSLVDAAKLADRLGLILAILVLAGTFSMASLLTLSSVAKRVRELGTLKALGWGRGLVVRQVVLESVVQGLLGGLVGAALGVGVAFAIAYFAPPLQATAPLSGPQGAIFGLGGTASRPPSAHVPLEAPVDASILLVAIGLAVVGGFLAGALGGLRAARLRPAVALRELA